MVPLHRRTLPNNSYGHLQGLGTIAQGTHQTIATAFFKDLVILHRRTLPNNSYGLLQGLGTIAQENTPNNSYGLLQGLGTIAQENTT